MPQLEFFKLNVNCSSKYPAPNCQAPAAPARSAMSSTLMAIKAASNAKDVVEKQDSDRHKAVRRTHPHLET